MNPRSEPKILGWKDLHEGLRVSWHFAVTEKEMEMFANLSGDLNPMHWNSAFSESRGFRGIVVYGGLLLAQLSRLVGMELPGRDAVWNRADIKFRSPLYVGEAAFLEAVIAHRSEATRTIEVKFDISVQGRLIANGVVGVTLLNGN